MAVYFFVFLNIENIRWTFPGFMFIFFHSKIKREFAITNFLMRKSNLIVSKQKSGMRK